jgi:sugar lactone lactonase YvrE
MRRCSLSLFILSGCAVTADPELFETVSRTWPEAPEIARIAYVGEFSSARDLSMSESFWGALVSLGAGRNDTAMVRPMAVATTPDGKVIFVADPDAGCVHRFDLTARRYRCLASAPRDEPAAPIGVTVTGDGHLFASDSLHGHLWQAAPNDKQLQMLDVLTELGQPTGISWNNQTQRLYVTDTGNQAVLEFDRHGNFKNSIGKRGAGPGEFNFPTYLWVDDDKDLLVTDSLNFRVQRFDAGSVYLSTFGEDGDRPGYFSRPKGVATDSFGNVYVVDGLMHNLQIFSPSGELLLVVGEQGQAPGQFWLPNGIWITADNMIFVTDSYNKRIQVFRYIGPGT